MIADRQATLDLLALQDARGSATGTRLYLHVSLTDLLGLDPARAVGEVEGLGPATLAKIREWVGHSRVRIQPVLDLARGDAVDAHDPPGWLRELVVLRDRRCVFPWCQRDARSCDLDHIDSCDPRRSAGPDAPGQPGAALCRRHHRCKTTGRWRYRRQRDGTYVWTAPRGRAFAVTPRGTHRLDG